MPDRKRRQKRLENGYCGICGTNRIDKSPTCDSCKEKLKLNYRRRVAEWKKSGLCTNCGKNKSPLETKCCKQCLDRATKKRVNNDQYKINRRLSKQKLKRQIMDYYGIVCVCCGESSIRFLTIDHIEGNGKEHRQQLSKNGTFGGENFYRWLRKNGFPVGFQTLCFNCNIGKSHNNNICPHKDDANCV